MLSYCLKCKKKTTESKILRASNTRNGETMLLSKCAVCGSKKSRLIKEQEPSRLLSSSGIKIPVSKITVFSNILF